MNFIIHSLNKHVTYAFGHETTFNAQILFGWRSKSNCFPQGGVKSDTLLKSNVYTIQYHATRWIPDLANKAKSHVSYFLQKI